jgi:hypothetical protein
MGAPPTQSTRTRTRGLVARKFRRPTEETRQRYWAQLRGLIRPSSVCFCVLTRPCLSIARIPRQKRPTALLRRPPLGLNPRSRSQPLPTCAKTHQSHQCLRSGLQFRLLSGSPLRPVCTLRPPQNHRLSQTHRQRLYRTNSSGHPWSIHSCRRRAAEPPRGGCRHGAAFPKTILSETYLVIEQVLEKLDFASSSDTANSGNE